jgi:hypothetical protein
MEETNALILLDSNTDIKVVKPGKALPAAIKKDPEAVHTAKVSGGFVRLFPSFYQVNNQNVVDPKTKKKITEKATFTRYLQVPGQEKTAIFTTKEVYFIPLDIKFARQLYLGKYDAKDVKPPDCQSVNGIVPQTNKIAKSCDECPHSKWQNQTPPPCGEMPEILALDMTSKVIKDPEEAQAVTKEAVTLSFKKSAIAPLKKLMKELAEPVLFDDGSYGQIDMTQYMVKVTLEVAIDGEGKEANYCVPTFEIVGQVPFEVSEQLLQMLNSQVPNQGNKTVRELFVGRTEPFTDVSAEEPEAPVQNAKVSGAAPPPAKQEKAETVTIDVEVSEPEEVPEESVAPVPVESDDDEVVF